ncbi:MAG: hypothetical protein LBS77_02655 [Desulfovibrio sp.]|jgi:ATP-dependent DNA helicase RecG|nr:hypothetical protein [Desulfovibrio sp.]
MESILSSAETGKAIGLPNAKFLLEELPNKLRELAGAAAKVNLCEKNGRKYIEIVTSAYTNPISYHGRYYQRSGRT